MATQTAPARERRNRTQFPVELPEERVFDDCATLTAPEIRAFKRDGILVKSNFLDPQEMERAVDRCWELVPEWFERDRPETWNGTVTDSCHTKTMDDRKGRLKYRECLRQEKWIYDILVANAKIRLVLDQLLGEGEVADPKYVRGLYPVFPVGVKESKRLIPHVDKHPFHVGVVGYLEDVTPGGGGFTVWPGSHAKLYHQYDARESYTPKPGIDDRIRRIGERSAPVEIPGKAGDVVFWHYRLVHTYGFNRSDRVRQAILGDFYRKDMEQTQDLPPTRNMWEGWAI